jgi:hypothetical protein
MNRFQVKALHSVTIATLIALGADAWPSRAEDTAAVEEILRLKQADVPEETILIFIRTQDKRYDLSAERIVVLRDQGLPPAVLNAMLESGKSTLPAPLVPEPVPTAPPVAPPTDVAQPTPDQDVAYFRQELSPYGRWLLSEENQWYWQPTVAVDHPDWRPYWDRGHWVYTDHGWYWSSDYPWGWAAFHYGRWNLHPHHGWIWYPDREWAPAWVTWRLGGDYCGWAPLPQYSRFDYATGGLSFHGSRVEAGFSFGLGFSQFNFSYLREMGDRPRAHFRKEADARRVYNQTTVINNYTVSKSVVNNEVHPRIINQGIDPGSVAAVRGKRMETVKIQDRQMPAPARVAERVDTRTKTLDVYRPRLSEPNPRPRALPPALTVPRASGLVPSNERGRVEPATKRPAPGPAATAPSRVAPDSPMNRGRSPTQASPQAVPRQAAPEVSRTVPARRPADPNAPPGKREREPK